MTDQEPNTPRRLLRSREDRVVAGVAGGLARHFDLDPVIFRIGFAALALFGGLGVFLYLAAVLFVPSEGGEGEAATPSRNVAIAGGVVLLLVALAIFAGGPWGGPFWLDPFGLAWLLVLAAGAVLAWRLVDRRRGAETSSSAGEVLRRLAIVLGVLVLMCVAAVGAAWGTAVGGGEVVAGLVIASGGVLVVSAFYGGAAWLVLPALALAVPAGLVAAADVELDGGIGEELHRPQTPAEVRDDYRLAVGRLELDLRDVDFPPGPTPLDAQLGIGQIDVIVPEEVCVTSTTDVGIGAIDTFGRESGGIDVDRRDSPPARPGVPRLVLDADVGIGQVRVVDDPDDLDRRGRHRGPSGGDGDDGGRENDPCLVGSE
ncbi:MAG: PspC domain-containing protein [Thermoleophilaceae bacterium]